MNTSIKYVAPMAFAFVLSACGGGSSSSSSGGVEVIEYKGTTTPATLSSSNQGAFAQSSAEVVAKAIAGEDSSDALDNVPFGAVLSDADASQRDLAQKAVESVLDEALADLPVAGSQTINGDCGGSAKISGSEESATISYSNYCLGTGYDEIIFDGKVIYDYSTSGSIDTTKVEYQNFSIQYEDGESYTLSGTMVSRYNNAEYYMVSSSWNYTIKENGQTGTYAGSMTCNSSYDCEYYDQVKGSDGSIYQVADLDVYDYGSYYSVEATFYHPDYGYVELSANNITLCEDGSVGSGSISLNDGTSTLVVTFNGCGADPVVALN